MSVLLGHKALRDEVLHDPTLDASCGGVDGGVLETTGAVAGPVMGRLGRRRGSGRGSDPSVGGGVGELDWLRELDRIRRREVEEAIGLGRAIGADGMEGLVTVAGTLVRLDCTAEGRSVAEARRHSSAAVR